MMTNRIHRVELHQRPNRSRQPSSLVCWETSPLCGSVPLTLLSNNHKAWLPHLQALQLVSPGCISPASLLKKKHKMLLVKGKDYYIQCPNNLLQELRAYVGQVRPVATSHAGLLGFRSTSCVRGRVEGRTYCVSQKNGSTIFYIDRNSLFMKWR